MVTRYKHTIGNTGRRYKRFLIEVTTRSPGIADMADSAVINEVGHPNNENPLKCARHAII